MLPWLIRRNLPTNCLQVILRKPAQGGDADLCLCLQYFKLVCGGRFSSREQWQRSVERKFTESIKAQIFSLPFLFQVRDPSICGMSLTQLMHYMTIPEESKLSLYTELYSCTMPILQDKTVWIMMVLITIFDLDSDDKIKHLRDGFSTILKRYLEENTKSSVILDSQNIVNCINTLPKLARIFLEIKKNFSSCRKYTATPQNKEWKFDLIENVLLGQTESIL